jgi:hypothetical protein
MGICFHRGPTGEPVMMLVYQGLQEMDVGGCKNGASVCEGAQCGGSGEGCFVEDTERYVRALVFRARGYYPLPPNDIYIRCTALLTSRHCILNIYSINISTECFKHAA